AGRLAHLTWGSAEAQEELQKMAKSGYLLAEAYSLYIDILDLYGDRRTPSHALRNIRLYLDRLVKSANWSMEYLVPDLEQLLHRLQFIKEFHRRAIEA